MDMIIGPRKLGYLLLLIAIPILEFALLFKTAQGIGIVWTVLLVVGSSLFGSYVIYSQGFHVMSRVVEAMSRGVAPIAPVIDGFFLLIAGLLLIVPGLITSALGLSLLVPQVRRSVAVLAVRNLMRNSAFNAEFKTWRGERPNPFEHTGPNARARPASDGEGPIIEGEYRRIDDPPPHKGERPSDRPR
jgi:UPF0716 protein FxsA